MPEDKKTDNMLYCTFCGKCQTEVKRLIAGPMVFICNECIGLCNGILEDKIQKNPEAAKTDWEKRTFEAYVEHLEEIISLRKQDIRRSEETWRKHASVCEAINMAQAVAIISFVGLLARALHLF